MPRALCPKATLHMPKQPTLPAKAATLFFVLMLLSKHLSKSFENAAKAAALQIRDWHGEVVLTFGSETRAYVGSCCNR